MSLLTGQYVNEETNHRHMGQILELNYWKNVCKSEFAMPSVLWNCWLGFILRKSIQSVKKLSVGMMVMVSLQLCTY